MTVTQPMANELVISMPPITEGELTDEDVTQVSGAGLGDWFFPFVERYGGQMRGAH